VPVGATSQAEAVRGPSREQRSISAAVRLSAAKRPRPQLADVSRAAPSILQGKKSSFQVSTVQMQHPRPGCLAASCSGSDRDRGAASGRSGAPASARGSRHSHVCQSMSFTANPAAPSDAAVFLPNNSRRAVGRDALRPCPLRSVRESSLSGVCSWGGMARAMLLKPRSGPQALGFYARVAALLRLSVRIRAPASAFLLRRGPPQSRLRNAQ